ncbi:hypothetical protein SALBM217S_08611 [Streptomyces griseoloalbus]
MTGPDTAHTRRRPLTGPLLKSLAFVVVTALATTLLGLGVAGSGAGGGRPHPEGPLHRRHRPAGRHSVRISGVTVGEVTDVRVVQQRLAQVTFTVREDRRCPAPPPPR